MDLLLILLSLIATGTAIVGNTWDKSKNGIHKIRLTGWIAIFSAISIATVSYLKSNSDEQEKQSLRETIATTATDALIALTQKLSDKKADLSLTPRLLIFPSSRFFEEEGGEKYDNFSLAAFTEAIIGCGKTTSPPIFSIDLFNSLMVDDIQASDIESTTATSDGVITIAHINSYCCEPAKGRLIYTYALWLTAKKQIDTIEVVRELYNKNGTIEISTRTNCSSRQEIIENLKRNMSTGIGKLSLSDSRSTGIVFAVLPIEPIIEPENGNFKVSLRWGIGVVEGIGD